MLFLGDDWAEAHHDIELQAEDGRVLKRRRLPEGVTGLTQLHALIADHLGDDVRNDLPGRKPATGSEAHRDGGIEMAAGHMTDGEGHGDHAEAERKGHAEQADTDLRKRRSQNRAAAARECEPECADDLGGVLLRVHLVFSPEHGVGQPNPGTVEIGV